MITTYVSIYLTIDDRYPTDIPDFPPMYYGIVPAIIININHNSNYQENI